MFYSTQLGKITNLNQPKQISYEKVMCFTSWGSFMLGPCKFSGWQCKLGYNVLNPYTWHVKSMKILAHPIQAETNKVWLICFYSKISTLAPEIYKAFMLHLSTKSVGEDDF